MAHAIQTVSARSKLKPKREPYWFKLNKGFALGYRKMTTTGAGSWILRTLDLTTGKKTYRTLGDFADLPDHQRFDAAQKEASRLLDHICKGGITAPKTIKDVCSNFIDHIKRDKTERNVKDVERRFNTYVLDDPKFACMEISKLKPENVDKWFKALKNRPIRQGLRGAKRKAEGYALDKQAKLRTPSTLNRDIAPFRAALNRAFEDGWVTTDFAWRSKLKPIKGVEKRRTLDLDKQQRSDFIAMATPEIALFLHGLSLLPVRPGALAQLTVADFDKRLMNLRIKIDKTGTRTIKLPPATSELFATACKDKMPSAPIFARADGTAWNKDSWKGPIKTAARASKMPEGTTAYTLRHSVITDLVHGGSDLLTVAQISGTSVSMIEKHYGHLRGDVAANALAMLAL